MSASAALADVDLSINGAGQTSIFSSIDYTVGDQEMGFRLGQPGACFDFGAQQQGVSLSVVDINGHSGGTDLYGLTGINLNSGMLALTTSEFLRCFVTDDTGDYILAPGGQSAGGGELLFASGFEDPGAGTGDIDLRVEFQTLPPSTLVAGQSMSYAILVSNVGTQTVGDVAFHDLYPASTDGNSDLFDAVLTDGTWACTATGGASCGALVSSTGRIRVQDLSLPAGGSLLYEISGRALFDIPAPPPGTVMDIAAGAVAGDGADFDPADNTVLTNVTVITAPAGLAINPANHDFGAVAVDGLASQVFEVSNNGDASTTLTLGTLSVDSTSEAFSINAGGTTCGGGTVLSGGDTCDVEILFEPGVEGLDSGSLDVTSDAGDVSAPLAGEGVVPDLDGDQGALDFGNVILGAPAVLSVQLFNADDSGATAVTLTDLDILFDSSGVFSILGTSTCTVGTVLSGSTTCQVDIEFDPDTTAGFSAGLATSSDVGGNFDVSLTGQGIEPLLEFTPANGLSFGDVVDGMTSSPMVMELSNPGTFDLTVTSVSTPGNSAFAESGGSCPGGSFVIAPASSCTIEYTFTPDGTGAFFSSVQVLSNALSSPDSFGLQGTGVSN